MWIMQPTMCIFDRLNNLISHCVDELHDETRLEDKDELKTMLKVSVNCFKPTMNSHRARRVRATCQFAKLKKDVSQFTEHIGGLWFDHKQKTLPMRKHEGQIEYFGKRGMSLLGAMFVRREKRALKGEEKVGLACYFYDVVVDKFPSQDNVQVLAIFTSMLSLIHAECPTLQRIMVGSDNASCLVSHDSIPYIHNLNQQILGMTVGKWTRTEACAGKNRLDTHFSYANVKLKSHVMDGHDVITEKDTCDVISYHGGISRTTAVLFDGGTLEGPVLRNKKEFKVVKLE